MIGRLIRIGIVILFLAAAAWGRHYPLIWVQAMQPHSGAASEAALVETTRVQRGAFTTNVTASGKLRARTTETVRTEQMEGKLVWIAADGAPIKKGDVVARLDDDEPKRQVRDIGLEYENARSEIEKAGRDRELEQRNSKVAADKADAEMKLLQESNAVQIKQAERELEFRKADLERLTTEFKRKNRQAEERLIPRTQVEEAEIAMNSADFAKNKAEKDLKLEETKATSAVQQKQTELENARFTVATAQRRSNDDTQSSRSRLDNIKRRLDDAKQRLDWCTLRSPISGLLVLIKDWYFPEGRRVPRPGDQLWPNKPLADIPDLSVMAVDCKIAERDMGSVKVAQVVRVRLDERPEQPFHGLVTRISSVASDVSPWDDSGFEPGTKVFTVTVELRERDPKRLIPGMNATMEITTKRIPAAVYVTKSCVFDRGAEHVVYVKRGPGFEPVTVEPAEENDTQVRIRRGLKGGEAVATADPTRKVDS